MFNLLHLDILVLFYVSTAHQHLHVTADQTTRQRDACQICTLSHRILIDTICASGHRSVRSRISG